VLECVEIKKLVVFPGCCLGQQESALVESAAMLRCWRVLVSLKRLDGFDSVLASMERGGRIGANPMDTEDRNWCLA
jgi:hypothetical protein